MSSSLLDAAFAHNVWATLRAIDPCLDLSTEELRTTSSARGAIIETLRHIVADDANDLFILTGDPTFDVEVEGTSLPEPGVAMERIGAGWSWFISRPIDPEAMVREVDEIDGYERTAPVAFRLAQALHHGTDHRSQICTALTTLGVEPPAVDVMSCGLDVNRIMEKLPGG